MSWAEFQLRLFSFNRAEKREWVKVFELSKNIINGSMIDQKGKRKIVNGLHKDYLGVAANRASEAQREHFINELKKYQERKNAKVKR